MMLPSAAAASGPRAKRARQPDLVQTKDTAGPMDVTELSRLVRDLCRQHDKDRVAWFNMVEVTNDHAKMIDELEHEALQVTDNMSSLMDNMMVGIRHNENKLGEQVRVNLVETTVAMQVIDSNLRLAVNETKKEFDAHKKDSGTLIDGIKDLIKELQDKFQVLDQAMAKVDVAL